MFGLCKHDWKLDKTILPSAIEVAKKAGATSVRMGACLDSIFSQTLVIVATCSKCGKIKKYTERS